MKDRQGVWYVMERWEEKVSSEETKREKEVFAVRVWLNPWVPLRWVLGRAPSHLDSYENIGRGASRALERTKGGRRIFPRAQGHTQSFSSPLRSEMGRKSLISHNLTLCTKLHTSVDAHKGRNKFAHVTDTHSLTLWPFRLLSRGRSSSRVFLLPLIPLLLVWLWLISVWKPSCFCLSA